MKNNDSAFIKAFPINWIVTIVVTIPLWIIAGKIWGVSFLLGSVVSMMMMSMMYRSTKRILSEGSTNVERKMVMSYIVRYVFYAIILVISIYIETLTVYGVIIGLFTFRLSIYISVYLEKRGAKE